jgi:hypothetical protein
MADRRLIITVPAPTFKALAEQGRQYVRSPEQQAAFIVRQFVSGQAEQGAVPVPGRETTR